MSRATLSLVQRQDAVLRAMLEPRTSERRANRMRSRVVGRYCNQSAKLGYTKEQVDAQARDLWDMYNLEAACDD